MNPVSRIKLAVIASRQLGLRQMMPYAQYQLGLYSGHYQRQLNSRRNRLELINQRHPPQLQFNPADLPERKELLDRIGSQSSALFEEANEITNGYIRLFGAKPVRLQLTEPIPLQNWTKYETGEKSTGEQDIKLTWEQGRFGWACKLAMAYYLSADERYADAFWSYTDQFLSSNAPYLGPHWSSAQEAAIRLTALSFSIPFFTTSGQATPERLNHLAKTIAVHAERIPPTMVYAQSQNNNHLITEALGLYTAAAILPDHPLASRWHALGKKWLIHALRTQIAPDGTYVQHSTNYHRLMLQCALWAITVQRIFFPKEPFPADVIRRLGAATRWLWKLVDPESGQVPNLGHNDGSYILPLSACSFNDYRPVVYAAAKAFINADLQPAGPWDDMSGWLMIATKESHEQANFRYWHTSPAQKELATIPPHLLLNPESSSWAYFRVASFHSRPAHADQLHLDLWWRGLNLAQDPGTYLYNAPSPWENSLTSAFVHNTVTVDSREFMQRTGRFLYLEWAQATMLESQPNRGYEDQRISASHDGYRSIDVEHTREVIAHNNGSWEIRDKLEAPGDQIHTARLHWLLPDWEYEYIEPPAGEMSPAYEIHLKSPHGWVKLKMWLNSDGLKTHPLQAVKFTLVRAGKILIGSGIVSPITGWTSPTYGDKIPALACIVEATQSLPIVLISEWTLPSESQGDPLPGP